MKFTRLASSDLSQPEYQLVVLVSADIQLLKMVTLSVTPQCVEKYLLQFIYLWSGACTVLVINLCLS